MGYSLLGRNNSLEETSPLVPSVTCSTMFASSTRNETFILEVVGCRSHSPVETSGNDFGGSLAFGGGYMWMSSMLDTSIVAGVSFLLTNSAFEEGGTSFLNATSDSTIVSISMLLTSTTGGDTCGDGGAGGDVSVGGDDGTCGDADAGGDAGTDRDASACWDGNAGGDGLDYLLILPFWVIFFWGASGQLTCTFADSVACLIISHLLSGT